MPHAIHSTSPYKSIQVLDHGELSKAMEKELAPPRDSSIRLPKSSVMDKWRRRKIHSSTNTKNSKAFLLEVAAKVCKRKYIEEKHQRYKDDSLAILNDPPRNFKRKTSQRVTRQYTSVNGAVESQLHPIKVCLNHIFTNSRRIQYKSRNIICIYICIYIHNIKLTIQTLKLWVVDPTISGM